MEKNLRHQDSSIFPENGHPGCMWSILHALHHHRWHHVKKMLPYKRHGGGRHTAVVGDSGSSTTAINIGELQKHHDAEMDKSLVSLLIGEKTTESSPVTKSSMKSRIKALITEEMSKRRGRHRRSTSYPARTQLARTNSIHHLELSDLDTPNELALNDKSPRTVNQDIENSSVASTSDPLLPKACEEPFTRNKKCELCAAMLTVSNLARRNVGEHGKKSVKDHTLLQDNLEKTKPDLSEQKLICSIEPSKDASLLESKQFMDALDIFNMRKELVLKILQEPSSPLAHYLQSHRDYNSKIGLTKSVSFPVAGSAGKGAVGPSNLKGKQGVSSYTKGGEKLQLGNHIHAQNSAEFESIKTMVEHSMPPNAGCREDHFPKPILARHESFNNPSAGSPSGLKNKHANKLVIKRFKNLRQKIRHAIRDSRKEKRRIIMDAVFHKIPYGRRFSKDLKEENVDLQEEPAAKCSKYSPGSSCGSDQSVSFIGKGGRRMRRTSSFNESLDRYRQLFESSSNREAKHHVSDRLKLRTEETPSPCGSLPKSMGRILSLPDLRFYSSVYGEDSPASSGTPVRIAVDSAVNIGSSRFDEQKTPGISKDPENQNQFDALAESEDQENWVDVHETFDDLDTSCPAKFSTSKEADSEFTPRDLLFNRADSFANQQHESGMDSPIVAKSAVNAQRKEYFSDSPHGRLDIKDHAEFNYVRDVLELSGFSGNELLGTWYSTDQPVDPSVFEEVEGCLLVEPDYFVNEGHKCNHLLLFDLINEVLLEIYERSFTYFPMPLICHSHIRPMPMGYHVLEEVWANISWYLSWGPEIEQSLDDAVSRDLAKGDGWMNLQFDAECVGLELEDMIFDDLLEECFWT